MTSKPASLTTSPDLIICVACGTQYNHPLGPNAPTDSTFISVPDPSCPLRSCRMCDDPRQFVPPDGHRFTTLERMWKSKEYHNVFEQVKEDDKVIELWTEPKFGIGQRACIIKTPHGNVMWDCIAYLDEDTVDKINSLGGLHLIIISHPHFYTTWTDWSNTFSCPIHLSSLDTESWLNRPPTRNLNLITKTHTELLPGLTAILAGGHFPGSMMLHSLPPNTNTPSLFIADTMMSIPSGSNPQPRNSEPQYFTPTATTSSYSFMWSIPNMIPLNPTEIMKIWLSIKDFDFRATYGIIAKSSIVREKEGDRERGLMGLRGRVLASMKIFVGRMGYKEGECEIMKEVDGEKWKTYFEVKG